jgi:hypothetical protein
MVLQDPRVDGFVSKKLIEEVLARILVKDQFG